MLILKQFVRPDGCMLPRKVTGLCKIQQKRMYYLVAMAQKAGLLLSFHFIMINYKFKKTLIYFEYLVLGLMSNLTPSWSKKDPTKRYKYKKYNTYWDEKTIPHKYRLNPNA